MSNDNLRGDKPHDDESTDDDQPDCSECSPALSCFEHYEVSESDVAPTAHTDGGETDGVAVGKTYDLAGARCTVEVATLSHDGHTAVLETVGADELREYVVPVTLIEETEVAKPA